MRIVKIKKEDKKYKLDYEFFLTGKKFQKIILNKKRKYPNFKALISDREFKT